jgi:hypothetical protein
MNLQNDLFGDETTIVIEGDMPEHPTLFFYSTGHKGGDMGHGSEAVLQFIVDGGAYTVKTSPVPSDGLLDAGAGVSFVAYGDWEITGLIRGLINLGRKLEGREELEEIVE